MLLLGKLERIASAATIFVYGLQSSSTTGDLESCSRVEQCTIAVTSEKWNFCSEYYQVSLNLGQLVINILGRNRETLNQKLLWIYRSSYELIYLIKIILYVSEGLAFALSEWALGFVLQSISLQFATMSLFAGFHRDFAAISNDIGIPTDFAAAFIGKTQFGHLNIGYICI